MLRIAGKKAAVLTLFGDCLKGFIPVLVGRWLDMEPRQLPGDSHMPRYQAPAEGASERILSIVNAD